MQEFLDKNPDFPRIKSGNLIVVYGCFAYMKDAFCAYLKKMARNTLHVRNTINGDRSLKDFAETCTGISHTALNLPDGQALFWFIELPPNLMEMLDHGAFELNNAPYSTLPVKHAHVVVGLLDNLKITPEAPALRILKNNFGNTGIIKTGDFFTFLRDEKNKVVPSR